MVSASQSSRFALAAWVGLRCLLLIGCQEVNSTEKKVVGTWDYTGFDSYSRVVFRRDHNVVIFTSDRKDSSAEWVPTLWGKWRLEGNEIVTDQQLLVGDHSSSERQVARMLVRQYEKDRLVRGDGGSDFHRAEWGVEQQYSEALALFYLIASVIALSAAIYVIRRPPFPNAWILLAAAAGLALIWSTSNLTAELAQTGKVIMSPASLNSLRVVSEVLRIVCILIFMSGLVKLAFALRVKVPASASQIHPREVT